MGDVEPWGKGNLEKGLAIEFRKMIMYVASLKVSVSILFCLRRPLAIWSELMCLSGSVVY